MSRPKPPGTYYERNKPYLSEYKKAWTREQRQKVLDVLGNKCVRCGFTDKRALQVDHVNGNGSAHRRSIPRGTYWRVILVEIALYPGKFQLLCANCNWIKRAEMGEN